ncbi:MAG: ABC transporter substrate-binding protein [Spirochaetales bacterium]|nr:ABC transporter substrate-binding protein [Spirochaetales bacterium]
MKKMVFAFVLILMALMFAACEGGTGRFPALSAENMIVIGGEAMPKSLNMYINYGSFSIEVCQLLYESLCERDMETWKLKGRLAESWTVSPDKLTYTFVLNKNAKWADGSPVTSEDVIFTYDTIMDENNLTSLFRMDFEANFEDIYAVDEYTVIFKAKSKRWSNFIIAYSFIVLPKHEYDGMDFNKDFNLMLPPGSGPYIIENVEPDRFITLKRRPDYWCKQLPNKANMYNFEYIKYKFILEDEIRLEALKKGEIDIMLPPSAKDWIEWVEEDPPHQLRQNWIMAKRVYNYKPEGYAGFHMNLRRKIFKDVRVRQALAYLLNVDLINEKIMYNQYIPLRSYYPEFFNTDADLPDYSYNPERARELLAAAGWDRVASDGVLINEKGERFEIEFTYIGQSFEKHLTIYKEDCGKVGININLNLISAAAYRKKVFEDFDFDMVLAAWGRGSGTRFPSIEDGWRSDRADTPNTNNIVGYKNTRLDELIDPYLEEYDIEKRIQLLKKIDLILTNDVPVILMWYGPYTRLYYWNKFGMPPTVFKKYTDDASEDSYITNWSMDQDKLKALQQAVQNNTALPDEEIDVFYDESLKERYAEISD